MLTVMLAVAWMPLTAHCQLEHLTGLEMLRCSPAHWDGASPGSDCEDGMCCSWESGQYHLPSHQPLVSVPLLALVPAVLATTESASAGVGDAVLLTAPPPGPPRPWQFSLRAALLARAPSFAS